MNLEHLETIERISLDIIDETIKDLLMNYKFLDLALSTINFNSIEADQVASIGTDGKTIYFNSSFLIEKYQTLNKKSLEENIVNNKVNFNINRMIMHSLLHCLGYDHIEDKDYEIMNKLEREILNICGYKNLD